MAKRSRECGPFRFHLGLIARRFYNGGAREKTILWNAYQKLTKHVHSVFKVCACLVGADINRSGYHTGKYDAYSWVQLTCSRMTEDFVIKYLWSAAGYGLMSIPILFPATRHPLQAPPGEVHHEVASRTESYVSNRRLLLSLADAGGRLMYSGKDLAELAGYTGRVYSLLASLHALNNGIYPSNPRPIGLQKDQVS
jgi:ATP-binding cassette subfamily D (ALD) long-chain fatty acid import protein